jgi:hypothetical protein
MTVPSDGSIFKMFDPNDPTSIEGAINQHGQSTSGITDFQGLIAVSVASLFDPTYAGTVTNPVTDITQTVQFKNYPVCTRDYVRLVRYFSNCNSDTVVIRQGYRCTYQPPVFAIGSYVRLEPDDGYCYLVTNASPAGIDMGPISDLSYSTCLECYGYVPYWTLAGCAGETGVPSLYFPTPPTPGAAYFYNGICYTVVDDTGAITGQEPTAAYDSCDDCVVANYTTGQANASGVNVYQYSTNSANVCTIGVAIGTTYFYGGTTLCDSNLDYIYFSNLSSLGYASDATFYISPIGGGNKRQFVRLGNTNWAKPTAACVSC